MGFAYFPLSRSINLSELFAKDTVVQSFNDFFFWTRALKIFGDSESLDVSLQRFYAGRSVLLLCYLKKSLADGRIED